MENIVALFEFLFLPNYTQFRGSSNLQYLVGNGDGGGGCWPWCGGIEKKAGDSRTTRSVQHQLVGMDVAVLAGWGCPSMVVGFRGEKKLCVVGQLWSDIKPLVIHVGYFRLYFDGG